MFFKKPYEFISFVLVFMITSTVAVPPDEEEIILFARPKSNELFASTLESDSHNWMFSLPVEIITGIEVFGQEVFLTALKLRDATYPKNMSVIQSQKVPRLMEKKEKPSFAIALMREMFNDLRAKVKTLINVQKTSPLKNKNFADFDVFLYYYQLEMKGTTLSSLKLLLRQECDVSSFFVTSLPGFDCLSIPVVYSKDISSLVVGGLFKSKNSEKDASSKPEIAIFYFFPYKEIFSKPLNALSSRVASARSRLYVSDDLIVASNDSVRESLQFISVKHRFIQSVNSGPVSSVCIGKSVNNKKVILPSYPLDHLRYFLPCEYYLWNGKKIENHPVPMGMTIIQALSCANGSFVVAYSKGEDEFNSLAVLGRSDDGGVDFNSLRNIQGIRYVYDPAKFCLSSGSWFFVCNEKGQEGLYNIDTKQFKPYHSGLHTQNSLASHRYQRRHAMTTIPRIFHRKIFENILFRDVVIVFSLRPVAP